MAAASGRRLVTTLGEHRRRLGLLQWQVAERLAELAELHRRGPVTLDANSVSRHESGRVYPSRRHRELYTVLYGVSERQLWPNPPRPAHRGGDPDAPDPLLSATWDHPGTVGLSAVLTGRGAAAVHRRQFLLITGAALAGTAHQWLMQEPGRLAAAVHGDRITPQLAGRLPAMVTDLRHLDDAHDPAMVLALVRHEFGWVSDMLANGTYTEATARELHRVLAELGQIAGFLSYDLDDQLGAQRSYLLALRAAHTAGDNLLGAHLLKCLAEQATETGRPADALTLLDSALAGVRTTTAPGQKALLHVWRARALALLADRRGCLTAIDTAHAAIDRAAAEDPSWLYWLTDTDITIQAGEALLAAGLADRAEDSLAAGLAALPGDRHAGDQQLFRIRLAQARLRTGHLPEALQTAHDALDWAELRRSPRAQHALRGLHRQLRGRSGDRGTGELLHRLRTADTPS
jgi:hypothetical protein